MAWNHRYRTGQSKEGSIPSKVLPPSPSEPLDGEEAAALPPDHLQLPHHAAKVDGPVEVGEEHLRLGLVGGGGADGGGGLKDDLGVCVFGVCNLCGFCACVGRRGEVSM